MPGGALCPGILRYADMQNGQERIKIMTDIVIQGIGGRMGHVLVSAFFMQKFVVYCSTMF